MIDLQHQCGSAAEAPLRCEAVRLPEMVKNIYGEIEKDWPFARPLCRHGVRLPEVSCSPKVRRSYRRLGSLDLRLRPSLPVTVLGLSAELGRSKRKATRCRQKVPTFE